MTDPTPTRAAFEAAVDEIRFSISAASVDNPRYLAARAELQRLYDEALATQTRVSEADCVHLHHYYDSLGAMRCRACTALVEPPRESVEGVVTVTTLRVRDRFRPFQDTHIVVVPNDWTGRVRVERIEEGK